MTRIAVVLMAALVVVSPAFAQSQQPASTTSPTALPIQTTFRLDRDAIANAVAAVNSRDAIAGRAVRETPTRQEGMSKTKRGLLAAAAGAGGFFGGAFLGAAIEGDRCNCDDPGFVGFWIGAPVGAATAAIVTWFVTR